MKYSYLKKIFSPNFDFSEVKIGAYSFLIMLIPVSLFIIFLELFLSKEVIYEGIKSYTTVSEHFNDKGYILYLTASVSHIAISITVIIFFLNKLLKDISTVKRKIYLKWLLFFSFLMVLIYSIFDSIDINLALLSHERVYSILLNSEYFKFLFQPFPDSKLFDLKGIGFYYFSIIPFFLIFLGLLVIVLTCLNIGKDLNYVLNKISKGATNFDKQELQTRIDSFHNYIYTLSFVLITSTIATLLYFQLPLTTLKKGDIHTSFQEFASGIGICWGVIFSLTMLSMCLYPFIKVQKELRKSITDSDIINDKETKALLNDIQNNYIIFKNLKSLVSVMGPTIISILAQFL